MSTSFLSEQRADPFSPVSLRWLQRSDVPLVYRLMIGNAPQQSDTHQDLIDCFESADTVGLVAEHDGIIVGILTYQLYREFNEVVIRNVVISPSRRRQGIATALLCRAAMKLEQNYDLLTAIVNEQQLDSQLFLRACGFRASGVLKDYFDDGDAIILEYRRRSSLNRSVPEAVLN